MISFRHTFKCLNEQQAPKRSDVSLKKTKIKLKKAITSINKYLFMPTITTC